MMWLLRCTPLRGVHRTLLVRSRPVGAGPQSRCSSTLGVAWGRQCSGYGRQDVTERPAPVGQEDDASGAPVTIEHGLQPVPCRAGSTISGWGRWERAGRPGRGDLRHDRHQRQFNGRVCAPASRPGRTGHASAVSGFRSRSGCSPREAARGQPSGTRADDSDQAGFVEVMQDDAGPRSVTRPIMRGTTYAPDRSGIMPSSATSQTWS
jgi:hypothetical protein